MDLSIVTKSIDEIATMAKNANLKTEKQISEVREHITAADARLLDLEQKNAVKGDPGARGLKSLNIGELVNKDEQLLQLRDGRIRQANITVKGDLNTLCKSVLVNTGNSGTSPAYEFPSPQQFLTPAPIAAPGRRLQVLQALPHLPVSAGTVVVPQVSTQVDGSDVQQNEGDLKGESKLGVDAQTLKMGTVASFLNASRQLADDVAGLPDFINRWLSYFVLRRYEGLIVAGDGSAGDGNITGLLTAGVLYNSSHSHNADKIGDAAYVGLPAFGYIADLVILNSADYFTILSERSTTNQYSNGAGWSSAQPGQLWGIRAVSTPALPSGKAIVLDSQTVSVLDRSELLFAIGQINDQFARNEFTYLSELRGNLAVGDPNAVRVVTLNADSPNS